MDSKQEALSWKFSASLLWVIIEEEVLLEHIMAPITIDRGFNRSVKCLDIDCDIDPEALWEEGEWCYMPLLLTHLQSHQRQSEFRVILTLEAL